VFNVNKCAIGLNIL